MIQYEVTVFVEIFALSLKESNIEGWMLWLSIFVCISKTSFWIYFGKELSIILCNEHVNFCCHSMGRYCYGILL